MQSRFRVFERWSLWSLEGMYVHVRRLQVNISRYRLLRAIFRGAASTELLTYLKTQSVLPWSRLLNLVWDMMQNSYMVTINETG